MPYNKSNEKANINLTGKYVYSTFNHMKLVR